MVSPKAARDQQTRGGTKKSLSNWTTNPLIEFVTIVVGDFLRVAVVWILLFLFDLLTKFLPVAGFAGTFIHAVHQAGSVALVLILVVGLLIDVIQSLRKK
jgi:hypothetical protein